MHYPVPYSEYMEQITLGLTPESRARLKAYAAEHDWSEARAARNLIEQGLAYEAHEQMIARQLTGGISAESATGLLPGEVPLPYDSRLTFGGTTDTATGQEQP